MKRLIFVFNWSISIKARLFFLRLTLINEDDQAFRKGCCSDSMVLHVTDY